MSSTAKKWFIGCGGLFLLAVIAAIIFPVFQRVPKDRTPDNCQSNLKQLGLAITQYAQDNDEKMPNISDKSGGDTWREAISPYDFKSKSLYKCPNRGDENDRKVGSDGFSQNYAANYTGSYGRVQPDKGNGAFAGAGSKPLSLNDFSHPDTTISLMEVENNDRPEFNIDNVGLFGPGQNKLWAGHKAGSDGEDAGSNYLFVDGSVKWKRPGDTYLTDGRGKPLHNFWYRNGLLPLSANGVAVLKDAAERFRVQ